MKPEKEKIPHIGFAYGKFKNRKHLVYAYSWIFTAEYRDAVHRHDFPQVWYCRRGSYTHYVDQEAYNCEEGSIIVVPAGVLHTFRVPEGQEVELMCMHISYELLLNVPEGQYRNMVTNLFAPCFAEDCGWQFRACVHLSEQSRKTVDDCLSWIALLDYAFCMPEMPKQLFEKIDEIFSVSEFALTERIYKKGQLLLQTRILPVYRSIHYLNSHYFEKILEENVLQAGGISRSGFYRYFRSVLGCSYSQYLQQLRVDHVYIYLKCTNYPLSYIADACGFFDMQYMSQVFSRYWGESPNRRRMHLRRLYNGVVRE